MQSLRLLREWQTLFVLEIYLYALALCAGAGAAQLILEEKECLQSVSTLKYW
jgi:hypothetical protein